jgi:hypothetical protein
VVAKPEASKGHFLDQGYNLRSTCARRERAPSLLLSHNAGATVKNLHKPEQVPATDAEDFAAVAPPAMNFAQGRRRWPMSCLSALTRKLGDVWRLRSHGEEH